MRLVAIDLTDFGPYRGSQRFEFAPNPGVELIWGENGRGKTTFLNALRWALFGVVLGRGSSQIEPARVGNRDDADSSTVRPFKVVLAFTHEGHSYKLTRAYVQDGSAGSQAFRTTVSMVKDGNVLGPDDRDRELARLLPEQIARFFLFDAELLQEYEQLLVPGSDAGERLKASIERILGVPVLTQARDDVAAMLATARTAQYKTAQKDKATKDLGNALQLAAEEAENERANVMALNDLVVELQNDVNELEKSLTSNSRFRGLMATRDAKRKEVDALQAKVDDRIDDLRTAAHDTWRAVLAPVIRTELTTIESQSDALTSRLTTALASRQVAIAVATGVCPTCHQAVGANAGQELNDHEHSEDSDALQADLSGLRARRDALRRMRVDSERIVLLEEEASQARVDLSDAEGKLRELESELADAPAGTAQTITHLIDELAQKNVSLANTRTRLKESREELIRKGNAVTALSEKLSKAGTPGAGLEDRKVTLLTQLHELLLHAVNEFRDRLRDRVEAQASEVFRALSAEKDYDRLRINGSYGLTILHADGSEVLNRSSGYEHVVALSLIAALQRCSPMSGPIITDSPFGRLDKAHKEHVLQALPQITDQVLLLVHDDELDRQVALDNLGTNLVAEHYLRRQAARHTEIESGAHP
ncbi:DNA sulfur modification protein DndD [Kribbella aluminosa]|uniref:Nuclease SbcCD subunit C n=1 Tax=Kribbella aluminosa TaxID=416017 RepID=A0ABS4USK2_9ACTN|nr:AAA family ATPase [Kribbella aluminosa]MBP2354628.1 DNA sulfur modification protein DndD [Kribbella aluminosa]